MNVHIDKKTGSYIFIQSVDGKPCPYVIADSPIAKRYAALQLIKKDLAMAKAAIQELQANSTHQLVKISLLSFAIISYGRCFTDAQGRGTKLNIKDIFKDNNSSLDTHNRLMSMRHTYIAHAGLGDFETAPVSITLNPDLNNKRILGHTVNAMTQIIKTRFMMIILMYLYLFCRLLRI
jgi:hypothetical protein